MNHGTIDISSLSGGFNLLETLESGQSYHWRREDGATYGTSDASTWYETGIEGVAIRVRQVAGTLEWQAAGASESLIRQLLRLDDDLSAIYDAFPDDPVLNEAIDRFRGMRIVRDPVFPCLISFICSTQMRVQRIHQMQCRLVASLGEPMSLGSATIQGFPTPDRLARTTEEELRNLGLGYRAPYVRDTAGMVADGVDPAVAADRSYEEARAYLTRFSGVGEKVADCVLLFSLGFFEAVPLDTWIRKAIATLFPGCDRGNYEETSRAIRDRLGGRYAGYAQTYLFHHLRTGGGPDLVA